MNSLQYWEERALKESANKLAIDISLSDKFKSIYDRHFKEVSAELNAMYERFAVKNEVSVSKAKQIVKTFDVVQFADEAKRMVLERDFSENANKMLSIYNLKMRATFLELSQHRMKLVLADLGNDVEKLVKGSLISEFNNENELQAGILEKVLGTKQYIRLSADQFINNPFKGQLWSKTIWENQAALGVKVEKAMQDLVYRGVNPRILSNELKKTFGVEEYKSYRLAVTEMARVQTEVQLAHLKNNDFKEYVYLAEPTACKICKPLHGKVFKVKDAKIGENISPMHPHCRCTTAPRESREDLEKRLQEIEESEGIQNETKTEKEIKPSANPKESINYSLADEKLADRLQVRTNEWFEKLSIDERNAIIDYTDTHFIRINNYLHGESLEDYIDDFNTLEKVKLNVENSIKNIDNALSKYTLEDDVIFYRGVSLEELEFYKTNNVIKSYKSLTTDRDVIANDFAEESDGVVVNFRVKKATQGAYIGTQSYNATEREFILGRNQKFTSKMINGVMEVTIE